MKADTQIFLAAALFTVLIVKSGFGNDDFTVQLPDGVQAV